MAYNSRLPYPVSGVPDSPPAGGGGIGVFDSPDAVAINKARMAHLDSLGLPLAGKSILDVGSGVGHLAQYFVEQGCHVTCVDGRRENIAALRARYPDMTAYVANVDTDSLLVFGQFDIVFCYGLLYHLENPVGALRNMARVTRELLLVESIVTDYPEPMLRLEDEPVETLNQAVGGLGCRPSPAFVAMVLARAGFQHVYAPLIPPDHPDFQFQWRQNLDCSRDGHLLRGVFVASRQPLANRNLALLLGDRAHGFSPEPGAQPLLRKEESPLPTFSPAQSYWNQRTTLAGARDRILALSRAVDQRSDLLPYQWAQLMAAALEFAPDLIIELGRGKGNSTCAFTEASHLSGGGWRILSLCLSDSWERETLPRLRKLVPGDWFKPLEALRADILEFNYQKALGAARRVLIFWDAHGFDIAECVLGEILPIVAPIEHLVIMHDLSDTRYCSEEQLGYGGYGLWKGNDWSGPRLKLGIIDSAVEQSVAALDFTTRNHITLDSADHSFHTTLSDPQQGELRAMLGELFDTQGHWFYFTLNEKTGPYKFPRFARGGDEGKSRR